MNVSKNIFINGIAELLVLTLLEQKDCYVYEIVKQINDLSNGLLSISQNTIYTATYKLEGDGKISEYSKLVGKKRMRVYYHIEKSGQDYLNSIKKNYFDTTNGVQNIFKSFNITKDICDNKKKKKRVLIRN